MARAWNKLSAQFVRGVSKRGRYADGGNLHLQVSKSGTKAWAFIYQRDGVSRAMGLGSLRSVPLAVARELAAQAREQLARGIDPIDAKETARLAAKAARARLTTFKQSAEAYYTANLSRWTNEKHRTEWISSMRRYAFPVLGHLSVDAVDANLVYKVLQPLIADKPVTASRLRGRIETVLDYAAAAGQRASTGNPAHKLTIGHMLPMQSEKANVTHQPALPFALVPNFMAALRAVPGTPARLLELMVLSAMRSNAARLARFEEFDFTAGAWTIPKNRMKALGRDHRVPLGPRAMEIVRELRTLTDGEFLFASTDTGELIGKNEPAKLVVKLLKAIGRTEHAVPHGFRSAFNDWCHEERDHKTEVVELALGHRIRSSVERSYRRGDLYRRRQALMLDWEAHCSGVEMSNVVALRA